MGIPHWTLVYGAARPSQRLYLVNNGPWHYLAGVRHAATRNGCDDKLDAAFAKNDFAIAREPDCSAKNEVDSQATGENRTNVMTKHE
jgi:hypothetical protein